MLNKIKSLFGYLSGRHTTRNAAVITTVLTMASRPLGYVRTLLVAYLFGASAFVDAYYVAFGSVTFLTGTLQGAIESAVMPKLVQHNRRTARDLLGWIVRALIIILSVVSILLLLFPEYYIRVFASTFDAERLFHAGNMVKWILPYALAMFGIFMLAIWSNYQGRFTLWPTILLFSNFISIPTLLVLYPMMGRYSLAAFQSLAFSVLALAMWMALRDMPLWPRHKVPWPLLKKTLMDILFCFAGAGASFIYTLVDRYFASSLPAGNVSAISYAQLIFSQPIGIVNGAMSIYLVRASSAVKSSREDSESQLFSAMYMSWSYFLPMAVLISLLAAPIVKLLLGYGAFNAQAVALTAPCLAVTAIGIPVFIWNSVVSKYGQALGKQKLFAVWSYIGLIGNYFLDAAMVGPYGAAGLCAATTIMWGVTTIFFVTMLAPKIVLRLLKKIIPQTLIVTAWSVPVYFISDNGVILPLFAGAAVFLLHTFLCERMGIYNPIPEQWRPTALATLLLRKFFKK